MELKRVQQCAEISVRRGLGFALLAVGCTMVGFSYDIRLALEVGTGCCLLVATLLFFRALDAPTRDYRKTETWVLLDKKVDMPTDRLQQAIGASLQELYRRYAGWMLGAAVFQWLGSVAARLAA